MATTAVNQRKSVLNDGNQIPVVGLGTWKAGYRHFDCAQFYKNESEVGEALKTLAREPGFKRKDIWITSKAWNSHHSPKWIKKALEGTLKDLGTDYVDLYLIHWPANFAAVQDPSNPDKILLESSKDGLMLLDEKLSLVDWRLQKKTGRTQGQVLVSWGIKRGFSVLPKSVKPARIESNFDVFDLDNESYERLTDLGRKNPARFEGLPFTFDPAWKVNVFGTSEENVANLLKPM